MIEADETYLGKRGGKKSAPDSFVSGFGWMTHPKIDTQRKIVALVERGGGVRSFVVDIPLNKPISHSASFYGFVHESRPS